MKARLDLLVLAPRAAAGTIRPIDRMLAHGDTITIGSSVTLEVLAMPGHTMTHIGLLGRDERGQPFLIAGDTLFAAGAGNCGYGGHAPTLYDTLTYVIGSLDGATQLYPGHDYLARNLRFATLLEPSNADVSHLIAELQSRPSGDARFTTLDEERRINPFLRCASPELRSRLEQLEPSMAGAVSDKEVFVALRCYRDRWTDSIPQ